MPFLNPVYVAEEEAPQKAAEAVANAAPAVATHA